MLYPWSLPCGRLGISFAISYAGLVHSSTRRSSLAPPPTDAGPALLLAWLTVCPFPQRVCQHPTRPPPTRLNSTSGSVGWGSVCFLLFAKGSHSLSSALFIIGSLGQHLPQSPAVPEGCRVTHYTVHPLLPLVPSWL